MPDYRGIWKKREEIPVLIKPIISREVACVDGPLSEHHGPFVPDKMSRFCQIVSIWDRSKTEEDLTLHLRRFNDRLINEHDRNVILDGIYAAARLALETLRALPIRKRLLVCGTNEDIEEILGNHVAILPGIKIRLAAPSSS